MAKIIDFTWCLSVHQNDQWKAPVNTLNNGHSLPPTPRSTQKKRMGTLSKDGPQQSITSVLFKDEHTLITASSVDGYVALNLLMLAKRVTTVLAYDQGHSYQLQVLWGSTFNM